MNKVIMAVFLPLQMAVCGCALFGLRQCVLHDPKLEGKAFTNSYETVWIKFNDFGVDYGHVGYKDPEIELSHARCEGGACLFKDKELPEAVGVYSLVYRDESLVFEKVDDMNIFPRETFKVP